MNTFNTVSQFVQDNNVTQITVGNNVWNDLINYVSGFYPNLDSEYYGNIMFNELFDLNVKIHL
jgi:hypothetical protein